MGFGSGASLGFFFELEGFLVSKTILEFEGMMIKYGDEWNDEVG